MVKHANSMFPHDFTGKLPILASYIAIYCIIEDGLTEAMRLIGCA